MGVKLEPISTTVANAAPWQWPSIALHLVHEDVQFLGKRAFKIYSIWLQASKQAHALTHFHNAVPLVWARSGSLQLPSNTHTYLSTDCKISSMDIHISVTTCDVRNPQAFSLHFSILQANKNWRREGIEMCSLVPWPFPPPVCDLAVWKNGKGRPGRFCHNNVM